MSKTIAKPTIDTIAAAVHNIPGPAAAIEFAVPPRDILPDALHPLVDELVDAHAVLAQAEVARAQAVQATRDAKTKYRADVFAAVRNGADAAAVVNTEVAAQERYDHAREIKKAAVGRVSEAHYVLTEAVVEHRDEIMMVIAPVAEADAADERAAAAALADARNRLSAVRGVQQWLAQAEPGKKNDKRPYRV